MRQGESEALEGREREGQRCHSQGDRGEETSILKVRRNRFNTAPMTATKSANPPTHAARQHTHNCSDKYVILTSVSGSVSACISDKWCMFVHVCRCAAPREKDFHHVSYCHGDHQKSHKYNCGLLH